MNVQIKAPPCRFLQRPQPLGGGGGDQAGPGATWTRRSTSCNDVSSLQSRKSGWFWGGLTDEIRPVLLHFLSRRIFLFFLTRVFLGDVNSEFGLIIEIQKEPKMGFFFTAWTGRVSPADTQWGSGQCFREMLHLVPFAHDGSEAL